MTREINDIPLLLHYYLGDSDKHSMNASIHNECERNFILSILNLQKYIECELEVEVLAKDEGGVISKYLVYAKKYGKGAIPVIATGLFTAWTTNFFRPEIHSTEETGNKIEIIEKIKKGDFTQREFDYIASQDKDLMKLKSNFYKTASKEESISKIETQVLNEEPIVIHYSEFHLNIIDKNEEIQIKEVLSATIYIVSPILIKIPGSKLRWRGIYNGDAIDFVIEDDEFLKQVANHEIAFESGTKIICTLKISTKTRLDEAGDEHEYYTYSVLEVQQWEDDKHFVYETKKYKKIQEDKRQLRLFKDEE